uniref:Cell division control protein n=3 Tax=Lygus hesperus TaxID=30085 RepID=A0A146L4S5_LYGHE
MSSALKTSSIPNSPRKQPERDAAKGKENSESRKPLEEKNVQQVKGRSPKRCNDCKDVQSSPPKIAKSPSKSPCTQLKNIKISDPRNSRVAKSISFPPEDRSEDLSDAIRALHTSAPSSLPCRGEKVDKISGIIRDCLTSKVSSTLYISGPPGTGKTACLNHIISQPEFSSKFTVVYINCTGIKSASSVYSKIGQELGIKIKSRTEKACQEALLNHLISPHKMILMVLDEIDQLESKRQSILYTIFEWPSLPSSNIVLVGIANALDLTDRVLPRLQTRMKLKPTLIQFSPYTRPEIIDILTQRLSEAGVGKVLSGPALHLLASKVAAISGDIRKALDVARRVLELAQQDGLKEAESVPIGNVMEVVSSVYGTSTSLQGNDGSSATFPVQQKLLICAALLIRQNSKCKELTIGKLHDVYRKICENRNIGFLDLSEFISLAELVESRGIIKIQGKTRNRLSKLTMQWDENEVSSALKDKQLLSSVLADLSVLPR